VKAPAENPRERSNGTYKSHEIYKSHLIVPTGVYGFRTRNDRMCLSAGVCERFDALRAVQTQNLAPLHLMFNVSARCLCLSGYRRAMQWFSSVFTAIAPSRTRDSRALVAVTESRLKGVSWMAKSRYDRNIDRGAAQQRNYSQGTKRKDNKPGTMDEEPAAPPRHGGAPKNRGGSATRDQEAPWRPKSRGDKS
jgi:hypothetical protein